jgi:hypothetical protein
VTTVKPKMHAQYPVRYKTVRGLSAYSKCVMDSSASIGHRLALKHPERVQALIVQNGNAHEEGLLEFGDWYGSR